MLIKICGITRWSDAELAAELGATAVGFIFWPSSPRFVDPHRARAIVRVLPPGVTPVGVFVNQPLEYVRAVAGLVRLGAIQLHGDEPIEYVDQIKDRVIRAVALDDGRNEAVSVALPAHVTLLVDTHDPDKRGGTGRTANWDAAARVARHRRTILSGGLNPENVGAAIAQVRPYGVDTASGVESRPGLKDRVKLKAFIDAARAAEVEA